MNLFDIFTPNNPAPAPQEALQAAPTPAPDTPPATPPTAVPATQGNIPPNVDPSATPPVGTPPVETAPAATPDTPLADFKGLWDTPTKSPDTATPPATGLNPVDVQKAMANIDFANSLAPDTMTQISAGGDEAQTAFTNAMNNVAQQVMVQSTLVNNKLTTKAIDDALAKQALAIPDMVRAQAAASHMNDTDPLYSNPAVKPVMEAARSQLLSQFPNATPAQITDMAQNYIKEMGKAFAPQETVNDNSGENSTDWDSFMS